MLAREVPLQSEVNRKQSFGLYAERQFLSIDPILDFNRYGSTAPQYTSITGYGQFGSDAVTPWLGPSPSTLDSPFPRSNWGLGKPYGNRLVGGSDCFDNYGPPGELYQTTPSSSAVSLAPLGASCPSSTIPAGSSAPSSARVGATATSGPSYTSEFETRAGIGNADVGTVHSPWVMHCSGRS